jgi:hypothetical protein
MYENMMSNKFFDYLGRAELLSHMLRIMSSRMRFFFLKFILFKVMFPHCSISEAV